MENIDHFERFIPNPYRVRVPEEKRQPILQELIHCYQEKFGDEWLLNLTKNLKPSPIKEIAQKYNVSEGVIRSLKHNLWFIGRMAEAMNEGLNHTPLLDQ
jgi:hypothetical protein